MPLSATTRLAFNARAFRCCCSLYGLTWLGRCASPGQSKEQAGTAQQVEVLLVETVVAVRGGGTIRVGPDGTGYEIGRTAGHARALRDSLARCVAAARQAGGGRRPGRERRASVSGLNHCGRGAGQGAGIEVKDRARVPAELVARFKAANAR